MTYVTAQLNPKLVKAIPNLVAELPTEYLDELIDSIEWNVTLKGIGRTTLNYYEGDIQEVEGHPIGEPYYRYKIAESFYELVYSWPEFAFALFCAAWKRNPEFDEYGWGGEPNLITKWKLKIINEYGDIRVAPICNYINNARYNKEMGNGYDYINRNGKIIDLENTKSNPSGEVLSVDLYTYLITPYNLGLGELECEAEIVEQVYGLAENGSIREGQYQIGLYFNESTGVESHETNCYDGEGPHLYILNSEYGLPQLVDEMEFKGIDYKQKDFSTSVAVLTSIIHTKYVGNIVDRIKGYKVKEGLNWLKWLPALLFKPVITHNSFMNWKYPPF